VERGSPPPLHHMRPVPTSTVPSLTITKVVGLMLGAAVTGVLLLGLHITRPAGALDAALTLTSAPTGELAVAPSGAVLTARDLRPGRPPATGGLVVRNQTGIALDVRMRARPASGDLDDDVRLRMTAGASTLFEGTLGELRDGSRSFVVRPGEGRRLRLAATVTGTNAQGRSDDVALELTSAPRAVTP
jgi:hypothetical protein